MVEKSKSTNDPLDLLTINRGMKDQLKHMREEKIEAAKHGETPLIVETATKDPGALFSQVIEKDQQMSKMKKDLEQSQSLINKYQADITDLKSRISNMDRELNKKQSSISGQEKTMREMNTQLEELKESKKKMTNELEELKKLKSEHLQDQNIQKGMEKKLEQLSKGGDQAKEQMNQNNKKLKSYESKISKLESSMKELKSEISEKKKKIGQLEEKLSGLNKEHESIEQMKVSSSQEVKKLKEQLNDVKKNSQLEINRLKGHIQHLEEENARISRYETSLIGSFKTKLSDAQKQNSEKEEQMNKLKEEQASYQKLLKKIEKKDMKIKNLQQSLGLMEDNLNLLRKNYRRDIVEMVDEVVLRDEIIDELETAIEETPDLIIVEEEIMMPEQPMQAPVPVELPNLSDIDFDTLEIPAMQSTPRAIEAKPTQKQETKLQTKQSDLIASFNLMFIQLFSKLTEYYKMSSWSWMLPVFIAMLGPVGAFVASKLMFKSNWRAWASAFYWMIPLVNLLVWLDFAFTVRGQKASKDLSDFDHSFGLIGFLPFMPRPSLQLPRATNNKKDQ